MDSSASTTFGTGIVVSISEANLAQMTEAALQDGYAIVQEFIDGGEDGDARILLLEGQILERYGKPAAPAVRIQPPRRSHGCWSDVWPSTLPAGR
ncbi:MAG TPA: hypothetical protein VJ820_00810 [Propionibacteriaceae bacterium]|nr:hypothetical protein [Propionibacteriaceae bacterium]